MKIVFDTNVIIDVLVNREPFADASAKAMTVVERDGFLEAMTANTITDINFLLRQWIPEQKNRKNILKRLITAIEVLDTTRPICESALDSDIDDFEDAVLVESARLWSADYIVTRNTHDFVASPIKALTPADFILTLSE